MNEWVAPIGGALAAAIVALFRIVIQQNGTQVDLSRRVGHLEGEKDGIERLSSKTLEVVHQAIEKVAENGSDDDATP